MNFARYERAPGEEGEGQEIETRLEIEGTHGAVQLPLIATAEDRETWCETRLCFPETKKNTETRDKAEIEEE